MSHQKWIAALGLMTLLSIGTQASVLLPEKKAEPEKKEAYKKVWEKIYGGDDDDIAYDIVALDNGESAMVGTCKSFGAERSDICVTRMDAEGEAKWRLMLGGAKEDEGRAITRSTDGNLYVLGMTKSMAENYDKDIYVAKVSMDGKLLWRKAMGGDRDEYPGGLVGTADGGVMLVGDTESFGKGYRDIYIAKLKKDGETAFARTIGGKKMDEARGVTRLKDGNFALVGMRDMGSKGYEEFFAMKFDEAGNSIWNKTFGEYDDDSLMSVAATEDGGMVAVGQTRSYGSEQIDLTVMKLSSNGKVLWHKVYGFKYNEYGNAITVTKDGRVIVSGGTSTLGKGSHSVYMLALESKTGALLWSHVYGDDDRDIAHGIASLSDGSIISVGQSESYSRSKGFHMIKIKAQH
jgi:outer membrane protein assembly factor BamB